MAHRCANSPSTPPARTPTSNEYNTGRVIVDLLKDDRKAVEVPAALVAGHGPFTWGATARKSLEHAIVCEADAPMDVKPRYCRGQVAERRRWLGGFRGRRTS
ncbi:class II aldolase/adducin family protein, partial [Streptomyces sp. NPDC006739]|uniref:class II aldolase/adducin family protein n=1 Tax=Streptomyces sp. NPDC006739 TaxID=3364763 RepID=UPI00368860E5